jgi:hypothetical protein
MRLSGHHIASVDGLRRLAFLMVFFRYGMASHHAGIWMRCAAYLCNGDGWGSIYSFFVFFAADVWGDASYELYEKQWLRLKRRFPYEKPEEKLAV